MSICIVPDVPDGATPDSFATAVHQLNVFRNINTTQKILLGFRQPEKASSAFGYRVNICAAAIHAGPFSDARNILENHTIWPLYAYTLPPSLREAWASDQITSEIKYPWRCLLRGRFPRVIIKEESFECLDCVSEDLNKFGLAYWRTYHQLPGVSHCIYHLSPLISRCTSCGVVLRSHLGILPVLACPHCGAKLTSSGVRGRNPSPYKNMLTILGFLFKGNWCIISPNFRRSYFEIALRKLRLWPLDQTGVRNICKIILKRWRCRSTKSMSKIFSAHISVAEIRSALEGFDFGCNPFLHLILLEHFQATLGNIPDLFCVRDLDTDALRVQFPVITGPFALPRDKQIALLSALDEAGISRKIAFDLAGDYVTGKGDKYQMQLLSRRMRKVDSIIPWFRAYRQWLAKLRIIRRSAETRRRTARTDLLSSRKAEVRKRTIIAAIKSPGRSSRSKVWAIAAGAMRWAAKHCPEWLESVLPPRQATYKRYTTDEQRKEAIVTTINDLNNPRRSAVSFIVTGPMRWAAKHCPEWLEGVLPPRATHPRYLSAQSRKDAILRAIDALDNPSRSDVWHMVNGPMRWAAKHCPEWLESVLPPPKKGPHWNKLQESRRT